MEKKIIKSILLLGVLVFVVSFSITLFKSKPSEENKESVQAEIKEISLIDELKSEKNIKISNENLEEVSVEKNFIADFVYYLDKSEKSDKPSDFKELFKGKGEKLEFITDFKYISIRNKDKEEYFKLPSKYEEDIKILFDKEIYTAFDTIKKYESWKTVEIQYKGNTKKINKEKIKEMSNKIKKKKVLSEYQASQKEEEEGFYIIINEEENELNIQIMGKNIIGIYNKDYKAYYEIDEELYNYLCDLFDVSKEDITDSSKEDANQYNWVQSIEVSDVVNKIDEQIEGTSKDELLKSLFSNTMEKVKFDTYEVKRYTLKLNGNGKTEKITVYENHIEQNGVYYKRKGVDLLIDSFLNEF